MKKSWSLRVGMSILSIFLIGTPPRNREDLYKATLAKLDLADHISQENFFKWLQRVGIVGFSKRGRPRKGFSH